MRLSVLIGITLMIAASVGCTKSNVPANPIIVNGNSFKNTFWGGRARVTGAPDFNYDIHFNNDNTALWRGNIICGFCSSQFSCTWQVEDDPTVAGTNKSLMLRFDDPAAFGNAGTAVKFAIISDDSLVWRSNAPEPAVKCIKKFRTGSTPDYNCF